MTIYPDFFTMADAILAHVASTHDQIVCCDSPRCLLIGFCTQNDGEFSFEGDFENDTQRDFALFNADPNIFAVRLSSCKSRAGSEGLTDSEEEAWINYIRMTEGRHAMAEAFSRGERLWQRRDSTSPPAV